VGANDKYVVECQHIWTNRDDGHNLDHLVCVLWKFENGKIVLWQFLPHRVLRDSNYSALQAQFRPMMLN
jgi:hypothetical protein